MNFIISQTTKQYGWMVWLQTTLKTHQHVTLTINPRNYYPSPNLECFRVKSHRQTEAARETIKRLTMPWCQWVEQPAAGLQFPLRLLLGWWIWQCLGGQSETEREWRKSVSISIPTPWNVTMHLTYQLLPHCCWLYVFYGKVLDSMCWTAQGVFWVRVALKVRTLDYFLVLLSIERPGVQPRQKWFRRRRRSWCPGMEAESGFSCGPVVNSVWGEEYIQ